MITSITAQNFMSHRNLQVSGIPRINLIIGKNDTCKTGLLKIMYTTAKSLEIHSKKSTTTYTQFSAELSEKMLTTFMPMNGGLGVLVNKASKDKLSVEISLNGQGVDYSQTVYYSFGSSTEKKITECSSHISKLPTEAMNSLFIPAKEVLTALSDIRIIREQEYGVGFDDTYLDLIRALDIPTSKGRVSSELSNVNRSLEELFEGKVVQTGKKEQPFVFKKGKQKFSMQVTAEGIKKIGILTTLINNRQLGRGTMLFLDEPETALHPDAIRQLIEMLMAISRAGAQVFMASHSYFVLKQLANCAAREDVEAFCWSLERTPDEGVRCTVTDLSDGVLPQNSIVQEAVEMYDQEIAIGLDKLK